MAECQGQSLKLRDHRLYDGRTVTRVVRILPAEHWYAIMSHQHSEEPLSYWHEPLSCWALCEMEDGTLQMMGVVGHTETTLAETHAGFTQYRYGENARIEVT